MKDSWDKAITFTLSWEGGYVNNPDDLGGETKHGISKRAYPNLDIKNLTLEAAKVIYKQDYWNKLNCDNLPYPLDIVVFDTAINMGIGRATTILSTDCDWKDYLLFRISRYNDIAKKTPQFLRGWINRTLALWKMLR